MNKEKSYIDKSHTIGRLGALVAMIIMIAIPYIISKTYNIWPNWSEFFNICASLLVVFGPINVAGVISYTPVLGTSFYLANITGNLTNLKLPCALNAIELAEVPLGTEESDIISSIAIGASSLLTIVAVALGVVLLIPLQPLLTSVPVQIATSNMLPALFGALTIGIVMNNKSGQYIIKGQYKIVVIPMLLVVITNLIMPIAGKEGFILLLSIPVLMLCAKIMIKKGMVKLVPINSKKNEEVKEA